MASAQGWLTGPWLELQPDDEQRAVWRWLGAQLEPYPQRFLPPLRPPRGRPRAGRQLLGAVLETVDDRNGPAPRPTMLSVSAPGRELRIQLTGDPGDAGILASQLLTHQYRGAIIGMWRGARHGLHVLIRHYRRALVELGYRVKPIARGVELFALIVSKGRHAWYLADVGAMTGSDADSAEEFCQQFQSDMKPGSNLATALREALQVYQDILLANFGTTARLTVGQSAIAAAARHIPDDAWVWRPPVGMVAMCRAGGAFRGGYVYYPPYRGEGHKVDLRRAYTWALSQPLPSRAALGACRVNGVEQPGIYVCRIYGPGHTPIYLSTWRGEHQGFVRGLWSGDECLAILPQAEFDGIRSLGYAIAPGYGYRFIRTFDLSSYTATIEQLLAEHGADSGPGRVAKALGNAVYGKLAERPERQEMLFAGERPGPEWFPFLDAAGDEVQDAYARTVQSYRAHQHVDLAAVITARVRGRLYLAIAELVQHGYRILAADTDGLLVDRDPRPVLDTTQPGIGAWRYEGVDRDLVIAGNRFFTFRGGVRIAGTSPQTRDVVELAYDRGVATVAGKVMAPPWGGGAMTRTVDRRLTRGARPVPDDVGPGRPAARGA